jgi:hypothetical protein
MEFMTVVFCYVISWSLRVSSSCDVVPEEFAARTEGGPFKGLNAEELTEESFAERSCN